MSTVRRDPTPADGSPVQRADLPPATPVPPVPDGTDGTDGTDGARGWRPRIAGAAGALANLTGQAARRVKGLPATLPANVRQEIATSVRRLAGIRSLAQARRALTGEAERLFVSVTPLLAAAPLPVSGWQARLAAGTAGGVSAGVEQAEAIAAAVSWGGALPAAPVVAGAVFTGWVLQLWIAVSARVNQLHAAGRQVDQVTLGHELAGAIVGDADAVARKGIKRVVRAVAVHVAERWVAGLVPGVGIAVDGYDAQRIVAAMLRQPVTDHPAAAAPA